ncbi:MAG: hypothetical protein K2L81_03245 [Muribaculaceae bacterium]|nr:hypothetical protein [Muribaculaceae bacterium]
MKKTVISIAAAIFVSQQAFCEAPAGWETMYFNHGENEYCAIELTGDIPAQLELYGNALVVSYEAPEKINGAISLSVKDVNLNGNQDQYNAVTFVMNDKSAIQDFIYAVGDGSTPITITAGDKSHKINFAKEAAVTFPEAYRWIKSISNAMNYE